MTATADRVRMLANGRWVEGWTSATVQRGIEQVSAAWSVGLTRRYPGEATPIRVRCDDQVDIYIGDDLVVTGFVDAAEPAYTATSDGITVSGRSRTGEIVDCSPDPDGPVLFRGQRLEVIARELCSYYSVDVVCDVDTGDRIGRLRIQTEETVYQALERAARDRGLLLTDDAWGRLVITRAGAGKADDELRLGENILSGRARFASSERFSEYRVKGQRQGNDLDYGSAVTSALGGAYDGDMARRRVKVIKPAGAADSARCRALAEAEALARAGKGIEATYTVQGWRQSTGRLWATNERVKVTDERIGFRGVELLITSVSFAIDGQGGSVTTLGLSTVEAYTLPPPKPKGTGGGSAGWKEIKNGANLPFWSSIARGRMP